MSVLPKQGLVRGDLDMVLSFSIPARNGSSQESNPQPKTFTITPTNGPYPNPKHHIWKELLW